MDDDIMNYPQTAKLLNMRIGTLYAYVHDRRIPHIRYGKRSVRFSRAALTEWMKERAIACV